MLHKIWDSWKQVRDNDPIKARLIRVLFGLGVVVMPFLTAWVWKGFGYAMGMVLSLIVTGVGLIILAAAINSGMGAFAHYVFTGKFPDTDDWFDNSILDEWEDYQNQQVRAQAHARAHLPKPSVTVNQSVVGNNNYVSASTAPKAPVAPKFDSGPDWMKNK